MTKLQLDDLFAGGGEPWAPILVPLLEGAADAGDFIGPGRDKAVVPVRELTFQALKPNPPAGWKVVIFGQNPYPRVQSATGIAMFDNSFTDWKDSQFGKVTSIRCIIKAAAMWKHKVPKSTSIADVRALLDKHKVVTPPEWFQAMLVQGVLLLNASLTASSDESMSTTQHTSFWKPTMDAIIEEILRAKQASSDPEHKGVVFAWWGSHAKGLRKLVDKHAKTYADVKIAHVDHCNPAAQGDMFCDGAHYADVNAALKKQKMAEIDWLPSAGWDASLKKSASKAAAAKGAKGRNVDDDVKKAAEFIEKTRDLHKMYLARLQGVGDEKLDDLPPITAIGALKLISLVDACAPIVALHAQLGLFTIGAQNFGKRTKEKLGKKAAVSADEIGALFLYTTESPLYKQLNGALREKDRKKAEPFFPYLALLLSALSKLKAEKTSLFRGVARDMSKQYQQGTTVTWWGVSSCTPRLEVASSFLGTKGKRMLFEVETHRAFSIKAFSALQGEEELLLGPGTQLEVVSVKTAKDGLSTVKLKERAGDRLVA